MFHVCHHFPRIGDFEAYGGIWKYMKVYGRYLRYMKVHEGVCRYVKVYEVLEYILKIHLGAGYLPLNPQGTG